MRTADDRDIEVTLTLTHDQVAALTPGLRILIESAPPPEEMSDRQRQMFQDLITAYSYIAIESDRAMIPHLDVSEEKKQEFYERLNETSQFCDRLLQEIITL